MYHFIRILCMARVSSNTRSITLYELFVESRLALSLLTSYMTCINPLQVSHMHGMRFAAMAQPSNLPVLLAYNADGETA
jgi:hypothetical protein